MNHSTKLTRNPYAYRPIFQLVLAFFLVFQTHGLLAQEVYQALLRGRHEVLPVASPAHGVITGSLDDNVLTITGEFTGLSGDFASQVAGGSHIHLGYAGQNGGIQLTLIPTLNDDLRSGVFQPENNTFELTADQMEALAARKWYINIHSTAVRSGELRGQLLPQASEYFYSNLLGSNEVPVAMSGGSGALALELNGTELTVSGSFQNLEGTLATLIAGGAHLHLGYAGQNGGIQLVLKATPSEDAKSGVFAAADNTFNLTVRQIRALKLRQLYANIHSSAFLLGEIRGQVLGMARTVFRAHLSGSNEIPAVTSLANGMVLAELMADGRLVTSGSFAGLESKMALHIAGGAHIHHAMAGANGPVVFRLDPNLRGNLRSGAFQSFRNTEMLSAAQVEALYQRANYVNIHSFDHPGGELRGQLLPESQMVFNGFLSSIFQTGGQLSTAGGGVKAELNGNKLTLSGSFQGLSSGLATQIAGGAHIHRGMAGSNGPVTQALSVTSGEDISNGVFAAEDNVFELSDADLAEIKGRGKYVNIHSQNFLPGEIRSQLLPEATTYFVAPLSGGSQTALVNTEATGMAILEFTGNRVVTTGSFNNLSTPLATFIANGVHIHDGMAGQNGPIIYSFNTDLSGDQKSGTFPAASNLKNVDPGLISSLRDRATYVNVHSNRYRPGEIRGQVLPLATAYFTACLAGNNSVQPKITEGTGQIKGELHGKHLVISGSFDNLTGDFATQIAGGSHLHAAAPGSNGPIRLFTTAELNADLKGGRFLVEDNRFLLDNATFNELIAGTLYLNLHSSAFRPGEIRGQLLGEINAFPSSEAIIESPSSGATVNVEGDPASPFTASWSAASDRDDLAYIWQLSTGVSFENLLVNENVGNTLSFTTDLATIDALLAAAGLEIGESITLFHRAVASDGSLATAGPTASVNLVRGMVGIAGTRLGAFPATNPDGIETAFKVYPTVLDRGTPLFAKIISDKDQAAQLILVNSLGQRLQSQDVDLFFGENLMEWALPDLASGFYFIQLRMNGKLLPLQRIVVD